MLQSERYAEEPHILRQIQTLLKLLRGELPSESVMPVSEEPSEDDLVIYFTNTSHLSLSVSTEVAIFHFLLSLI